MPISAQLLLLDAGLLSDLVPIGLLIRYSIFRFLGSALSILAVNLFSTLLTTR